MTVQEAIQEVVDQRERGDVDEPLTQLFRKNIPGLSSMGDNDPIQRLACQTAVLGFYAGRLYEQERSKFPISIVRETSC